MEGRSFVRTAGQLFPKLITSLSISKFELTVHSQEKQKDTGYITKFDRNFVIFQPSIVNWNCKKYFSEHDKIPTINMQESKYRTRI